MPRRSNKKETLTAPEWYIMETLWDQSPMFLSEIMDSLADRVDWTHTTFLTYLKKMIEEGYVSYTVVRGSRSYYPAISREDCIRKESRSLMSRMTDSSAKLFVTNMIREGGLTREDRNDLRNLIETLNVQSDSDEQ